VEPLLWEKGKGDRQGLDALAGDLRPVQRPGETLRLSTLKGKMEKTFRHKVGGCGRRRAGDAMKEGPETKALRGKEKRGEKKI